MLLKGAGVTGALAQLMGLLLCQTADEEQLVDGIVEVQGTAETVAFSQESFDQLMVLARKGIGELVALQKLTVA